MQNVSMHSAKIKSLCLGFSNEEVSVTLVSVKGWGQK